MLVYFVDHMGPMGILWKSSYGRIHSLTTLFIYVLILLSFHYIAMQFAAGPPTCPADLGGKCSDSGEWEGEFFPGIPKIKYEVKTFMTYNSVSSVMYILLALLAQESNFICRDLLARIH